MAAETLIIADYTPWQHLPVGGTSRHLGWKWKTTATGKQITGGRVWCPAGGLAAGCRWQVWRESPGPALILDILLDGMPHNTGADDWMNVVGVPNTPITQNGIYYGVMYHPSTDPNEYYFQNPITAPAHGTMEGSGFYSNGGDETTYPTTDGATLAFGWDVTINDVTSEINGTLAITLPAVAVAFDADAIASGSLGITIPAPVVALDADAVAGGTLAISLPAVSVGLSAASIVAGALDISLPALVASLTARAEVSGQLAISIPPIHFSLFQTAQDVTLRDYIWGVLAADEGLNQYGIDSNSLYASWSPDSPSKDQQRFMVIRWGIEEPRMGRDSDARRIFLSIWAYDRNCDYDAITLMLQRARAVLYPLKGVNYGLGSLFEVGDAGLSEDLYDEGYEAETKSWSLTIAASGI